MAVTYWDEVLREGNVFFADFGRVMNNSANKVNRNGTKKRRSKRHAQTRKRIRRRKAPVDSTGTSVANPFSTGGGGGVFEVKVESALVATLLVNGADPLFPNSYIHELHLQTGHEGYLTEDALLVSTNRQGEKRKSLWSIKRELAFTKGDIVFADVIRRAWKDFTNKNTFDADHDAIVIATGPLTITHKHFRILLEWARAAKDETDFSDRVARKGYASEEARKYLKDAKALCSAAAEQREERGQS